MPTTNRDQLLGQIEPALTRARQIQTQAATFVAQAPYGTANLANLNDLLAKCQLMAQAVSDLATDMIALGRFCVGDMDGTT